MLILLIVILIMLSLFAFFIFDRDILSPATVVSLGFFFSACCALYNANRWGLEFSGYTVWVVTSAIIVFIIGSAAGVFLSNTLKRRISFSNPFQFSHELSEVKPIYIEAGKTLLVILFLLVTIVWVSDFMTQVTNETDWSKKVVEYRSLTAGPQARVDDPALEMPFILGNMVEVSFPIVMVYAYIIGNNLVSHKKQQFINWIPIILFSVLTLMQGGRADLIRIWLTILIIAWVLHMRSVGWKTNKETRKILRNIAFSVIAVGIMFGALGLVVGRITDKDLLYHVTFYAGCPLAAFDQFLKNPIPSSNIWGKETFFHLNLTLNVLFGNPEKYNFYKDFIQSPNGTYIGNVYTAIRPPYYDFGFLGMLLVMFIMGAFFTFLYCKIRQKKGTSPIDFRLLLYSYIAYTFFMYFYNCYNTFICHTFLELCIELLLIRWFLVGVHFKWGPVNSERVYNKYGLD